MQDCDLLYLFADLDDRLLGRPLACGECGFGGPRGDRRFLGSGASPVDVHDGLAPDCRVDGGAVAGGGRET